MPQAELLRMQDVRDAYRLIGECRDLGRPCGIGGCWRGCVGSSGFRRRQEAKGDGSMDPAAPSR
jgi:hypothetical protein